MPTLQYPVNLNVENRPCLVIGGGEVAARKAMELERCGARVTVVAPEVCPELEALAAAGAVTVRRRRAVDDDIDGTFIVVAATDDPDVNVWASSRARAAGALVNVVDQPTLCMYTAPAVVRRGKLTIAVSTNGASPALAKRIKHRLSKEFGGEWAEVVDVVSAFRTRLRTRHPGDFDARRLTMDKACALDLATIVREHGRQGLEQQLQDLLDEERSP